MLLKRIPKRLSHCTRRFEYHSFFLGPIMSTFPSSIGRQTGFSSLLRHLKNIRITSESVVYKLSPDPIRLLYDMSIIDVEPN